VLLEAVLGRRPDGIVLTGTEHTQASRQRLARVGIPLVEAWDLCPKPLDMLVGFSHEAVGQALAHYLLGKGYRRVSVLSLDDPRGLRRYRSLALALAQQGVEPLAAQILPAPATLAVGREGLARLLQAGHAGEVVVCSSDTLAQGVLAEAASRGLRVPQDLAVIGFGDLSCAAHTHPPLTTVRIDGPWIGHAIAEALLARIAEPALARQPLRLDVGFELIERGSG
jgi:LacI family gluconate utilization system Gnt-I transcriptional repressor